MPVQLYYSASHLLVSYIRAEHHLRQTNQVLLHLALGSARSILAQDKKVWRMLGRHVSYVILVAILQFELALSDTMPIPPMVKIAKLATAKLAHPVVPPITTTKRRPNSRSSPSEITASANRRVFVWSRRRAQPLPDGPSLNSCP